MELKKDFWNSRYATNDIGWDLGAPSHSAESDIIDSLTDKQIHTTYLYPVVAMPTKHNTCMNLGFTNVYMSLILAPLALEAFAKCQPDFPERIISSAVTSSQHARAI
jgi:hypothetical protein